MKRLKKLAMLFCSIACAFSTIADDRLRGEELELRVNPNICSRSLVVQEAIKSNIINNICTPVLRSVRSAKK